MSSPRIAISAARDQHRRSPSARWRQAWKRRLAPQRLCDSYANPAPARIPENYGRTVLPRAARTSRMGNAPAICRSCFGGFPCSARTCTKRPRTRAASF